MVAMALLAVVSTVGVAAASAMVSTGMMVGSWRMHVE